MWFIMLIMDYEILFGCYGDVTVPLGVSSEVCVSYLTLGDSSVIFTEVEFILYECCFAICKD